MSDIFKQGQLLWLASPFLIATDELTRDRLRQAYGYGNKKSPDPSTKNGAVLVDANGRSILTFGVNKFPSGVAETEARLIDKETKYRMIVHAESSTILNAARLGVSTLDSVLYCPFYACSECAKAIIQGGVKKVVGHAQLMALASDHTTWVKSIVDAWDMLHEAGVQCVLYDGDVGVTTRFNGKDIPV